MSSAKSTTSVTSAKSFPESTMSTTSVAGHGRRAENGQENGQKNENLKFKNSELTRLIRFDLVDLIYLAAVHNVIVLELGN